MARVRVGSSRAGRGTGRASAPPTYPGTMSGYGPTRADSVGETVPNYAYSAAQQDKAYNKKSSQSSNLPKIKAMRSSEE